MASLQSMLAREGVAGSILPNSVTNALGNSEGVARQPSLVPTSTKATVGFRSSPSMWEASNPRNRPMVDRAIVRPLAGCQSEEIRSISVSSSDLSVRRACLTYTPLSLSLLFFSPMPSSPIDPSESLSRLIGVLSARSCLGESQAVTRHTLPSLPECQTSILALLQNNSELS